MIVIPNLRGSNKALAFDPFVDHGLSNDMLLHSVIPYVHSAKEGVEYLGNLIHLYGSNGRSAVAFSDNQDVWYMEILTGHHWIAQRIPDNSCAIITNQLSQEHIDFSDSLNVLTSDNIERFVIRHHLNTNPTTWNVRDIFGNKQQEAHRGAQLTYAFLMSDESLVHSDYLPFLFQTTSRLRLIDVICSLRPHYMFYSSLFKEEYTPDTITAISQDVASYIFNIRSQLNEGVSSIFWTNIGFSPLDPYIPQYTNVNKILKYRFPDSIQESLSKLKEIILKLPLTQRQKLINEFLDANRQYVQQFIYSTDTAISLLNSEELINFLEKQNKLILNHIIQKSIENVYSITQQY